MWAFPLLTFLAAFLLFQVQPILGRYLLPWFGGGPSVWSVCLVFFQTVLLLGYAYAHWLAGRPRASQAWIHAGVVVASLLALPIAPEFRFDLASQVGDPTSQILWLLFASVGAPYVVLASSSPLLQRWYAQAEGERPYRLYAVSNAGSLLALASYPFVFEPLLRLDVQSGLWSVSYVVFVAGSAYVALRGRQRASAKPRETEAAAETHTVWWLALSGLGSAMLLATTNQMSQEIAVVPFLWILPLAIYLVSFILVFDSDRWYRRRTFGFLLAGAVPVGAVAGLAGGLLPLGLQILLFSIALFAVCMICHGELAISKPPPPQLTRFYLTIAAGGAMGGLCVTMLAPRLFPDYWEYPLALSGTCVLALIAWARAGWRPAFENPAVFLQPPPAIAVALLTVAYAFGSDTGVDSIAVTRGFHGVTRILEDSDANGEFRQMTIGRTKHGLQYLADDKRSIATTYFGEGTGIELAIERHPKRLRGEPLSMGLVGLGVGTIAAYGRAGDQVRFYELNPQVADAARERFSFIADTPAEVDVVLGDARVRLSQETETFDLIAVDAFSSGAIPVHLLTAESGELYAERLNPGGIIAFHITNRYLDLAPVIAGLAERLDLHTFVVDSEGDADRGVSACRWMILTDDSSLAADRYNGPSLVWTDDFASAWKVLR